MGGAVGGETNPHPAGRNHQGGGRPQEEALRRAHEEMERRVLLHRGARAGPLTKAKSERTEPWRQVSNLPMLSKLGNLLPCWVRRPLPSDDHQAAAAID